MHSDLGVIYFLVIFFALVARHAFKRKMWGTGAIAGLIAGYLAWHSIPGVPALINQARKAAGIPGGQSLLSLACSLLLLAILMYGIHRMFVPLPKKKKAKK